MAAGPPAAAMAGESSRASTIITVWFISEMVIDSHWRAREEGA
jgi:hypothetical protein